MSEWTEQTIAEAIAALMATVERIDPDEHGPFPFRRIFDRMGEIRGAFKEVRFANRDHRQELWESLNSAGNELAKKRTAYRTNCQADQKEVASAISALDYEFNSALYGHSRWGDFAEKRRETKELLKNARFESRQANEEAWNSFNKIEAQVEAQREQKQRKQEEFVRDSEYNKKAVFWHIGRARPIVGAIADMLTLDFLNTRHDELKYWADELAKARQELQERGEQMTGSDRHDARDAISEVQKDLNAAWEHWKDLKNRDKERRADEWRERTVNRRDKLEEIIGRKEEFIARQEQNIANLEEKLRDAWSDDYVTRIQGWIDEATERRDNARDELRELENQLAVINEKLSR